MKRHKVGAILTCVMACMLPGCGTEPADTVSHGSAAVSLRAVTVPLTESSIRQSVYVPVYSSIYWGVHPNPVELAATVSVRNVSPKHPLILESVRYYDSAGKQVREYVSGPAELGALATVEFVIQQRDTTGGPGANFVIRWAGPAQMNEPIIEAVMLGQTGTVGISFTSRGVAMKDEH